MDKNKGIVKWITNKLRLFISTLMLALYNTEQSSLNQKSGEMGTDIDHVQTMEQESLLQDLIQGRITMEVKNLRWRMYKVLEASANALVTHTTNKVTGERDFTVTYVDKSQELRKIKTDDDTNPLEMVIDNTLKSKGIHQTLDTDAIRSTDKVDNEMSEDFTRLDGEKSSVLGEISSEEYFSHIKGDGKIKIKRDFTPKFEIEKHTKKLNIKIIDDESRLLEFYISKYPNEYDRKSNVLISRIKKIDNNPRASTLIHFDTVSFITYNDLGVADNLLFEFNNIQYSSTAEFDGYYVLKFVSAITINGDSQVEEFRMTELDDKYEAKEAREENAANYTSFL